MYTSRNIYDAAGRLTAGTRYAGASTTGTAAFTERGISYDKAGGMLALQRYGQNASTAEDNISLTYNGMRLSSVTGTVGGQSINASFTYDDCGRTTYDGVSALNYVYDQMGALVSVSDASTSTTLTTYRHLADGIKYATVSPSGGALIYRGPFTLKVADISASSPSVSFLRAETGSAGAAIIANASGTGAAPYYYVADHIGSIRAIVDAQGNIVERNDYYAYGKRHTTGRTYATLANSQLLFSGKEDLGQALDLASGAAIGTSDLRVLDFGARHYDPIVPRWTTQDPLAEKYYSINPYAYCAGDPVNLGDPEGKDIYKFDKETGSLSLIEKTEDDYDQIGRFDKNGVLIKDKKGKPKVFIDKIEKGILSDGINFKDNDNVIAVGQEKQASEDGVNTFIAQFADMVHKEIGGLYYSIEGNNTVSHISIGAYNNNTSHKTKNYGQRGLSSQVGISFQDNIVGIFHTHPLDFSFTSQQRRSPSDQDLSFKERQKIINPQLRFFILTQPEYGYEYKNEF